MKQALVFREYRQFHSDNMSITFCEYRIIQVQLKGRKAYDKSFQDERVIDVVGNQTTVHGLFPATDYEFQVAIKTECPELTYSGIVRDTTAIDSKLLHS